ncbi:MAG TPA: archaetidylserine decarboxylase [Xanthomonadales bacterium]|nr:archaetidylserine decarboxylase [Xanthomonadales bacterium]
MSIIGWLLAAIQYVLPHHLLSRCVYHLMRVQWPPVKNLLIMMIGGIAGVDWSESKHKDLADFKSFNDFFTRELEPGARPQNADARGFNSPCDGVISECGRFTGDRLVQAKGQYFSLNTLLARDPATAELKNGYFHTIYLAPHNYHRIHMPVAGQLQRMIHIPGRLFGVADWSVNRVPKLFARNERVVSIFNTEFGPMALVLVGAFMVGSIETVWSGQVTPPRGKRVTSGDWSRNDIRLKKGEEMGRFNMGSTVILIQPPNSVASLADYDKGDPVIVGQILGKLA